MIYIYILALFLWSSFVRGLDVLTGNTTCKGPDLDWYTSRTGETPCRTYERLRQLCNGSYLVGNFTLSIPGDSCDDVDVAIPCCCNSVAFYLSMLCYNCQVDLNSRWGEDASTPGSYQKYLGSCTQITNQSLPDAIQVESCNNGIKIYDALYSLFWVDGTFFYEFTKGTIVNHTQNGEDYSSHCENIQTVGTSGAIVIATGAPSPSADASSAAFPRTRVAFFPLFVSLILGVVNK